MATGTGKTIAALGAAASIEKLDFILIAAPTKEIVRQWVQEIEERTTFRKLLNQYLRHFFKANSPARNRVFSAKPGFLGLYAYQMLGFVSVALPTCRRRYRPNNRVS